MDDITLKLIQDAYIVLSDFNNQWPGRYTGHGQSLLCRLRDTIAHETGRDIQDIQDNMAREVEDERMELANQRAEECRETSLGEWIEEQGELAD